MYNEKEDFLHHEQEVVGLFSVLSVLGIIVDDRTLVLDLGAGQGMHAGLLSRVAGRVYGADVLDYSSLYGGAFLKLLREKYERNGYAIDLSRLTFNQTDAMALMYRDNLFDLAVSMNSFEHIQHPGSALRELIRVTKSGGCIFISFDPVWTADTGGHFYHRVPEPWGHLVYRIDDYVARMLAAGADEREAFDYIHALNRWRPRAYSALLETVLDEEPVSLLHQDAWSGVTDGGHQSHPNFTRLLSEGFEKDELMLRGIRWVFRKK